MKSFIQSTIYVSLLFSISSFTYCYANSEVLEDAEILVFSECYEEALTALDLVELDLLDSNDKYYNSFLKAESYLFLDSLAQAFFLYKSIYNSQENEYSNKSRSRIAYLFYVGGEYEKTIDILLEGPTKNYKFRDQIILSRAYKYKREFEKAHSVIDILLKKSETKFLLQEKAKIYIHSEDYLEAVNIYTYILDFEKDDISYNVYNNLIYSLNKLDPEKSADYIEFIDFVLSSKSFNQISRKRLGIYYQNKAEYYSRLGCHDEAVELIDLAILIYFNVPSIESINLKSNRDKQSLLDFYDEKIRIYKAAQHLNLKECFDYVDKVINWLKVESIEEDIHFRKSTDYNKYYKEAFKYFLSVGNLKEAYLNIAKIKDSSLRQSIILNSFEDSKFTENVRKIKSESFFKEKSLNEKNKLRIEALGNYIEESTKDSFFNILDLSFDIENFQSKIPSHTIFVDYYILDGFVHTFLISNKVINYSKSDLDLNLIKTLKGEFTTRPKMTEWSYRNNQKLQAEINKLSKTLLPASLFEYENVIIIPHDELNGLVFEPMTIKGKKLINLFNLSYSSSIFLASYTFNSTYESNINFVIGDLDETKLKGSKIERKRLQEQYEFSVLKEKAKLLDSNRAFNILHFSNHSSWQKNRLESYINLGNDEKLKLGELLTSNLKSNMVFLAGCETRAGETIKSEGMYGLSRVYFQSGVKSIVSSMHKINDASSEEIISKTYIHLYKGENIVSSLRKAKLDYLKDQSAYYSHPYFWAGIVLEGNTEFKVKKRKLRFASIFRVLENLIN